MSTKEEDTSLDSLKLLLDDHMNITVEKLADLHQYMINNDFSKYYDDISEICMDLALTMYSVYTDN